MGSLADCWCWMYRPKPAQQKKEEEIYLLYLLEWSHRKLFSKTLVSSFSAEQWKMCTHSPVLLSDPNRQIERTSPDAWCWLNCHWQKNVYVPVTHDPAAMQQLSSCSAMILHIASLNVLRAVFSGRRTRDFLTKLSITSKTWQIFANSWNNWNKNWNVQVIGQRDGNLRSHRDFLSFFLARFGSPWTANVWKEQRPGRTNERPMWNRDLARHCIAHCNENKNCGDFYRCRGRSAKFGNRM